jgi:hypothetical protein
MKSRRYCQSARCQRYAASQIQLPGRELNLRESAYEFAIASDLITALSRDFSEKWLKKRAWANCGGGGCRRQKVQGQNERVGKKFAANEITPDL